MIVDDIVPLCPDRFIAEDIHMIMADYCAAMRGDNDTMAAMRKFFTGKVNQRAIAALPFTSAKKYGGVSFHEDETYLLGAPEVILGGDFDAYREKIDHYSAKGCRVLLLALYDGSSPMKRSPPSACPSRSYCSPTRSAPRRRIRSRGLRARVFPCA